MCGEEMMNCQGWVVFHGKQGENDCGGGWEGVMVIQQNILCTWGGGDSFVINRIGCFLGEDNNNNEGPLIDICHANILKTCLVEYIWSGLRECRTGPNLQRTRFRS